MTSGFSSHDLREDLAVKDRPYFRERSRRSYAPHACGSLRQAQIVPSSLLVKQICGVVAENGIFTLVILQMHRSAYITNRI